MNSYMCQNLMCLVVANSYIFLIDNYTFTKQFPSFSLSLLCETTQYFSINFHQWLEDTLWFSCVVLCFRFMHIFSCILFSYFFHCPLYSYATFFLLWVDIISKCPHDRSNYNVPVFNPKVLPQQIAIKLWGCIPVRFLTGASQHLIRKGDVL